MSGDRVLVQPAWVLHRRPWSESSLIVELFSRDFGRIGAVARGGRNSRRWRGLLEPFSPVLASWQGRGELRSLVAAEPDGARPALAGAALASGFYLNELLLRLLRRDDPHPELHPLYGDTLNRLPDEAALRGFECRLLEALGYGLLLLEDMGVSRCTARPTTGIISSMARSVWPRCRRRGGPTGSRPDPAGAGGPGGTGRPIAARGAPPDACGAVPLPGRSAPAEPCPVPPVGPHPRAATPASPNDH